jgi:hypothetical protein
VGGMEKLLPDPDRPGAGGDDADLPDVHRRSARNEEAMEAFGDDLGREAGNRKQDRGQGGIGRLTGRRAAPCSGGTRHLPGRPVPHAPVPPDSCLALPPGCRGSHAPAAIASRITRFRVRGGGKSSTCQGTESSESVNFANFRPRLARDGGLTAGD